MQVTVPSFPGSPAPRLWTRAGAFIFFGIFLCGGVMVFYQMTFQPMAAWWRALEWERASATVESSKLLSEAGSKGTTVYSIDVQYSWTHMDRFFRGGRYGFTDGSTNIAVEKMREEVRRLAPGAVVECWVNPQNPSEAVLVRKLPLSAIMGVFFSLPFLTAGILGTGWGLLGLPLVKVILRNQVKSLRHLRGTGQLAWPMEEDPEAALKSGEARLIFARTERVGAVVMVTALNFFWNGIVAVFVFVAISEATGGSRGAALGLGLFLLPFIAIGAGFAWLGRVVWRNFLRSDWVAVIHPVPGLEPVQCRLSFATQSPGRDLSWDFKRLRLVAMAAPRDVKSKQPQRSPWTILRGSRNQPSLANPGTPPKDEHELTALEFSLPGPGQTACLDVPAMPEIASGSKQSWARWWALEIEHRDGRLESFELSTEK